MLQGNHDPITVTQSANDESLILVKTQRDADWSMQRLIKAKYNEKFSIKIINKIENEIANKIIDVFPNTLKIELSNPCNPKITAIDDKISINEKQNR
ncbi:hypothetical protein J4731_20975 [Providencia rettgeri]|nr:hypothetical protein [Providencia rettgeri]